MWLWTLKPLCLFLTTLSLLYFMATITPTCVFIDALIFFIVWYVLSSLWDAHLVLCVLEHFHSWAMLYYSLLVLQSHCSPSLLHADGSQSPSLLGHSQDWSRTVDCLWWTVPLSYHKELICQNSYVSAKLLTHASFKSFQNGGSFSTVTFLLYMLTHVKVLVIAHSPLT